ncbi:restriction endonuclease subunit S, partial [uncultured Clostridium sp.]|uniref:restriction endonuclease subunit S n=1 Tax=uncultured Clostridium sp. TaxID=59620 RepID=UPI00272E9CC1
MKKYKIGELGSVFTGNTPSKRNNEFYESDDIMFIKPDILSFDIIDIKQSNEYLSEKARKKARIIPKGSLLVSCIGNIGKLGINIEEVAGKEGVTKGEIAQALADLQDAVDALKETANAATSAEKTELVNKIDQAAADIDTSKYSEASVALFNKALAALKEVAEKEGVTKG